MFERYTEKARRTIFFARYEASQYGSPAIETEHLLLGLLREDALLARRWLNGSANLESLRSEIETHITRGERISTSVDMRLSAECARALRQATEEADRMASERVGTEHVLLGLLEQKECPATRVLTAHGIDAEKLRVEIGEAAAHWPSLATASGDPRVARIGTVLELWAAGMAKEFAMQFSPEGHYADPSGATATGPEEIALLAARLFKTTKDWLSKRWQIRDVQLVESIAVVSVDSGACSGAEPAPGEIRLILLFKRFSDGWRLLDAETAIGGSRPGEGAS